MSDEGNRIEVVRGRVEGALAEEITSFWAGIGVSAPEGTQERLSQVACVLRTPGGEITGVNSAYAGAMPMIGNRVFWIYRSALAPEVGDGDYLAMARACFDELARGFEETGSGPVGLALRVTDTGFLERHPEAIWPQAGFLYAGFANDGAQIRIRYFEGARI